MQRERTFLMLKPDAVQRGLIGEVLSRLESKGLKPVALKLIRVSLEQAEKHYAEHVGKPFYEGLLRYIRSGPVLAMVWEGKDVVSVARQVMGKTNPRDAGLGTIRGDFGMEIGRNIIHGADSLDSAAREIPIYFTEEEILSWERIDEAWVYE